MNNPHQTNKTNSNLVTHPLSSLEGGGPGSSRSPNSILNKKRNKKKKKNRLKNPSFPTMKIDILFNYFINTTIKSTKNPSYILNPSTPHLLTILITKTIRIDVPLAENPKHFNIKHK